MTEKKEKKQQDSWSRMKANEIKASERFNAGYIDFLSQVKTEREAVAYISKLAREKGFKELHEIKGLKPGDKVMMQFKSKVAALIVIGQESLEKGTNLVVS